MGEATAALALPAAAEFIAPAGWSRIDFISDLHLGSRLRRDVLRQPGPRRVLLDELQGVDRLVVERRIDPCMSEVFPWSDIPKAHMKMWKNEHRPGNMAVLVSAPTIGLKTLDDAIEAAK